MMFFDPLAIPVIAIVAVATSAIGVPIARAFARRIEHGAQQPRVPADVSARLERMEQSIDTIAVEIERIAEAQRFTTRLLAERAGEPRPPARVEADHVG